MATCFLTADTTFVFRHVYNSLTLREACTHPHPQTCFSCLCAQGLYFCPWVLSKTYMPICGGVYSWTHMFAHRRGLYTLRCRYVLRLKEHEYMLSKWSISARIPEGCAYVHIGSTSWTCTPLHCPPEMHTHPCTHTHTHILILRPCEARVHRHTQFHRCIVHRDTHVDPCPHSFRPPKRGCT